MKITISMYKDEFNAHKKLNAAVLEEVLKRMPHRDNMAEEVLNEERSLLFDHLFEETVAALDKAIQTQVECKINFLPNSIVIDNVTFI